MVLDNAVRNLCCSNILKMMMSENRRKRREKKRKPKEVDISNKDKVYGILAIVLLFAAVTILVIIIGFS